MYPSLWDGLPRHTGIGVDVVVAVSHGVGVSNPAHLSGSCAHVRCWHIQSTTTHQIFRTSDATSFQLTENYNHIGKFAETHTQQTIITFTEKTFGKMKFNAMLDPTRTDPGPMNPFLASSMVNLRVILSSSVTCCQETKQPPWQPEFPRPTHRVLGGINSDSSLSSPEWDIHHGTFEGHQSRKCTDFIFCHLFTVPDAWKTDNVKIILWETWLFGEYLMCIYIQNVQEVA